MSSFGENLKTLRKSNKVSQKVLADHLGVAQNTIANYENNKRFPDMEVLTQIANYFNISLDSLLGRMPLDSTLLSPLTKEDYKKIQLAFMNHLFQGKTEEAIRVVLDNAVDNESVFALFDKVLRKTSIEVGERWHQGRLNVAWEHYAMGVIDKIVSQLSAKLEREPASGKTAICLTYSSDPHTLAIKMISEFLSVRGYQTFYLGTNTTTDSLIEMFKQLKPDILAISVTMAYHLDGLKNLLDRIYDLCDCSKMKIIVGGQAFDRNKDFYKSTNADYYAADFWEFEKIVMSFEN